MYSQGVEIGWYVCCNHGASVRKGQSGQVNNC